MTAICGGLTSSPKPGVPASLVVDQQYVQSLLPPGLAFLYPYLPFMQGLQIGSVSSFCGTDPPNLLTLPTPSEFLDFLTGGNFANYTLVNLFLTGLTQNYLWRALCQCSSGSPTAVTPPSNPGNLPVVNPPGVVSLPTASPCILNKGSQLVEGAGTFTFRNTADWTILNGTSLVATINQTIASGAGSDTSYAIHFLNSSGVDVAGSPVTLACPAATTSATHTYAIPSGATNASATVTYSGTGTESSAIDFAVFCNGANPNGPAVPCCPPNSELVSQVNAILNYVTLLQRQLAPFAYISSTVHSGLTGAGSLSIQGLLGVLVTITADSSSLGSEGTSPTELFGRGFVTFATADGSLHSTRIERTTQLVFPCDAGIYTTLYYDLNPLVTVSITELLREP